MYGDSEVIRRHAGRLREQGVDIRTLADSLVAQAEGLRWSGRAADAMRERVRERAARLRDVAARHEAAAESLEAHAQEVDGLKDAIADIERRAEVLVAEARSRVARATSSGSEAGSVTVAPDPTDQALVAFEPPASGHRDWLHVSLPGL